MPKRLKQLPSELSEKEKSYREEQFKDVSTVFDSRLFCTCCLKDVKNEVLRKDKVYIHPFFQVLVCKSCLKFYGNDSISADEDGSDKYCRWCGQGGCLYICSECPVAICKICITRNMSRSVRNQVEKEDWKCFNCNPEPLFELRGLAWALKQYLKSKKQPKKKVTDNTSKVQENSLVGQLLNGLDYELSSIKEIQKLSRSFDMKLGWIARRKEVTNREEISWDKVKNVSEEISNQLTTYLSKLNDFKANIDSYFKDLSPVISKLMEEEQRKKLDLKEQNDALPNSNNKRLHSSDEESEKRKRKKDTSSHDSPDKDTVVDETESPSCKADSSSLCEVETGTTLSNGVHNEDWTVIQDSNEANDDLYTNRSENVEDTNKPSSEDSKVPKLTLRIRKIDEVNKVLMEEGGKGTTCSPNSPTADCEVIEIDDDTSEQCPDNAQKSTSHSDDNSKTTAENLENNNSSTKDSGNGNNSDCEIISKICLNNNSTNNASKQSDSKQSATDQNSSDSTSRGMMKVSNNNDKTEKKDVEVKSKLENTKSGNVDRPSAYDDQDIFRYIDYDMEPVTATSLSSNSSQDSSSEEVFNKKKVLKKTKEGNQSNKRTKCNDESSDNSDIDKLLNTKNLDKKKKSKEKTENTTKAKGEKKKDESVKKEKEKSILDYCGDEESDDSVIDLSGDLNTIESMNKLLGKNAILAKMRSSDFIEEDDAPSSLESSEAEKNSVINDSDDLLRDSDDERNAKKKSYSKKASNANDEEDSDESEGGQESKSTKWKKDKLLTMKLSDDSGSDSSVFKKKKKNDKSENRSKKKTVLSDSDDEMVSKNKKNSSESSGSEISEEETPKKKRSRIKKASSSSDENGAVDGSGGKGHRKNIRKVLKKDSLQESTQTALKEEEERKKRIIERQKLYNLMMEECEKMSSKSIDKLVLDFNVETKEELLSVDKDLVVKLKPHQVDGIKFMWDSCFETVKKAKKGKGSGCILAHCMGLGKTLQVVTLLHTLMANDIGVRCALVLCPLSTVLNWANEFEKWLSEVGSGQDIDIFHMTKITAAYRAQQLKEWHRRGGVMILGYNLFRLLVNPTKRIKPAFRKTYMETLTDPGPDIVICDEGHLLKNEKTALSKAVEKIKTLRRVVLTGTPLQNNLIEYHCMMQFVKPSLLGTKKEFTNRFVSPIENGQFVDSTPHDVKIMKRRAHVLHKMLDGVVQRKAYNVLVPFLPVKHEYVLSLSLHDIQVKLYQHYLDNFSRSSAIGAGTSLFKDRNTLGLICAHPRLLMIQKENELLKRDLEESDEEGSLKDFIDDSTSESSSTSEESDDSTNSSDSSSSVKKVSKRKTRNAPDDTENAEEAKEVEKEVEKNDDMWWNSVANDDDMEDIGASSKLFLFFTILQKCVEIGDKLLLFSQSLLVLDLIEYFLDRIDTESPKEEPPPGLRGFTGTWVKGIDYFRLDGKTSSDNRANWCKRFNSEDNYRGRLFLISTRAGGLGINLTGANRVILFDASWNPSHDVQSIFRVYRFGQSKPCYIYRFLNKGTMEQKVYDRQVTKLSMSCRVIDEQQIDRHFSFADLNELYVFTPNERDDKTPPLPKDRLMAEMLQEHKDILLGYHTHDSLLENQIDEELNEEERKQAWADFENEKKPQNDFSMGNYNDLYLRVYTTLKEKYPNWGEPELRQATLTLLTKMNHMNNQHLQVQPQPQQHMLMQNSMNMQQHRIIQQNPLQGTPAMYMKSSPYQNPQNNYMMAQRLQNMARNVNMAYGNMQHNLLPNPFAKVFPNPFNQNVHTTLANQAGTSKLPNASNPPPTVTQQQNPSTSNK